MKRLLDFITSIFSGTDNRETAKDQTTDQFAESNSMIYKSASHRDILTLAEKDDLTYSFVFSHTSSNGVDASFRYEGEVRNIDPEGLSDFDFLDPTGEDNPTEWYIDETADYKFNIYLPTVVSPYVGIAIESKQKGMPFGEKYVVNLASER